MWKTMRTAPKDGSVFLAELMYRDGCDGGIHTVRWHEPWGQWVLSGCLIGIQNNAKDDENLDPVRWQPLPNGENMREANLMPKPVVTLSELRMIAKALGAIDRELIEAAADELDRLRDIVRTEREACAVVAETVIRGTDNVSVQQARGAEKAANAIRARDYDSAPTDPHHGGKIWSERIKKPWQSAWVATHRHSKGGLYRAITSAVLEVDAKTMMTVYDDEGGTVWVRPSTEFHDGRFTPIDAAK